MRLLLLTNVFPSPWHPTKGTFNFELARALAVHHEMRVIVPIPWLDVWRKRPAGLSQQKPAQETRSGMTVYYPAFYYTPKLGRRWYHHFLWNSLRSLRHGPLSSCHPDAVIGYWTHPDGTAAVRLARSKNAAALVMVGGSDLLVQAKESAARGKVMAETLRSADGVIAVSADLQQRVCDMGVATEQAHLIYRGVDESRFCPGDRQIARQTLDLPATEKIFLWVGRMVSIKGLPLLIDAVRLLRKRAQGFRLVLAGDGPDRAELTRQVSEAGLSDCIHFAGRVAHADLADWYRAADWSVLSSHSEGVPNVLLESHACGVPFIATSVGGVSEIAVAGIDRLVAAGDSAGFAEQMEQALQSPAVPQDKLTSAVSGLSAAAAALTRIVETAMARRNDVGLLQNCSG